MIKDENCVFCKIVSNEIPSYKIWEDSEHVAFLTLWPNTEGFTVLAPKEHYPSYFAEVPEEVVLKLVSAARKVAKLLDESLDDVGRTGLIFEGFGVNHLHLKLSPMHGTKDMTEWKPIHSKIDTYFEKYEGYISSHDSKEASSEALQKVTAKIKKYSDN